MWRHDEGYVISNFAIDDIRSAISMRVIAAQIDPNKFNQCGSRSYDITSPPLKCNPSYDQTSYGSK
jgi:hypothetical protein